MTQETLKLALEAMESVTVECNNFHHPKKDQNHHWAKCPPVARWDKAITAIKEALAQEQEPVADSTFLERVLAAMEGVIDVADRKTNEFDALRGCIVDLTLMLHLPRPAPVQQEPEQPPQRKPLTDEMVSLIAHNTDPGDWNNLNLKDSWHCGFKQGFKTAEIEYGVKRE